MPNANERSPVQGVQGVADAARDSVDRGAEGDREMAESMEDPRDSGGVDDIKKEATSTISMRMPAAWMISSKTRRVRCR